MKVYPLGHITPEESNKSSEIFHDQVQNMNVSDDDLIKYTKWFFENYRTTIKRFFYSFSPYINFYSDYPFKTSILRLGENGIITGHRSYKKPEIRILRPSDFDPPLSLINIFDIQKRLKATFFTFSFVNRKYDASEAEIDGKRQALNDALNLFWLLVEPLSFAKLCEQLIKAEGVNSTQKNIDEGDKFDAIGEITFDEPGGSRRVETWAFDYKTYRKHRISAKELRESEQFLTKNTQFDVICLITSGDLTSIGNNIVVNNPKIRIWDRYILNVLVNEHLDILEEYFSGYKLAVTTLQEELEKKTTIPSNGYQLFEEKLKNCPPGQEHFTDYENICVDIFKFIFSSKLGEPKYQSRTFDKKQRRDILFRNQQTSRFFQRIANKFGADFIILDCKNYSAPIESDVVFDVAKYVNKALGRFIIVASRYGSSSSVEAAQLRVMRDDDAIIIIISDVHLLEMLRIYEKNENPEDVLEDLVDEALLKY